MESWVYATSPSVAKSAAPRDSIVKKPPSAQLKAHEQYPHATDEATVHASRDVQTRHPTQVSSASRLSAWGHYVVKRRWILAAIALFCLSGMIVGILYAAHAGYVRLGGQGWLRRRDLDTPNIVMNTPASTSRKFPAEAIERLPLGAKQICEGSGQPVSLDASFKVSVLIDYSVFVTCLVQLSLLSQCPMMIVTKNSNNQMPASFTGILDAPVITFLVLKPREVAVVQRVPNVTKVAAFRYWHFPRLPEMAQSYQRKRYKLL